MKIMPQRPSRKTRRAYRLRQALSSRQARRTVLVGSILGLIGVAGWVRGASPTPLNWNPNTTTLPASATDGGAGTWDLVTANWYNPATTADQIWQNDGSGVALFGGPTGGLVSATALNVGGMTFNTTGYTVQGGTLTLGGGPNGLALPTITVAASVTANVTSVLAGSNGLTVTGGGKLVLGGANTYTGVTTLNGPTILRAETSASAFGASTLALTGGELQLAGDAGVAFNRNTTISGDTQITSDVITLGNAAVTHTLGTLSIGANVLTIGRGANVGTGIAGITFGATTLTGAATFAPAANTLLTVGAINNGANTLTLTGAGNFTQAGILGAGAGGLTLASGFSGVATLVTGNTFTGPVNLNGGVLAFPGAGNADPTVFGAGPKNVTLTNNATLRVITASSDPSATTKSFVIGAGGGTFDASGALTFTLNDANQLSGTGNLTVMSSGTGTGLVLVGQAAVGYAGFTGNAIVNSGTLRLGNTNALGNTAGQTVTVNSGGTLDIQAAAVPQNVTINGAGVANVGALTITSGSLAGTLTLGSNASLGGAGAQTLATAVSDGGHGFTLTKLGAGTLTFTGGTAGFTGPVAVTAGTLQLGGTSLLANSNNLSLAGGTVTLLADGLTTPAQLASGVTLPVLSGYTRPTPEVAATYTDVLTLDATGSALTVGKLSALSVLDKYIVESGGLTSNGAFTLTVNNNNGYGLNLTGTTTLNTAAPTFSVTTATASNLISGLTLQGQITGAFGFTKTGAGTMVLANSAAGNPSFAAANNFVGNITVGQGVLSVDADSELGNSGNVVNLAPTAATSTLRATGSFSTARLVQLGSTANTRAIEVTAGNTLTLTSPFVVTGFAAATLAKNDGGTLVLSADNTGWSGAVAINQGALRLSSATAAGSGAISVNAGAVVTTALQLSGTNSFANPITLSSNGGGLQLDYGINGTGLIDNVSGSNSLTGVITLANDVTIGADAGTTLNITGTNLLTGAHFLAFLTGASATINVQTAWTNPFSWWKTGPGTLNIATNQATAASGGAAMLFGGKVVVSGAGVTWNQLTKGVVIEPTATLQLDDSGTGNATAARLGGAAAVTMNGGTYNYIVNAAGSTETEGVLTIASGGATINIDATSGGTNTLTFASLVQTAAGATVNFSGAQGTANNKVIFTAAPVLTPATTGILARDTVGGVDFATYSASTGITASTYNASGATNINAAAATDTFSTTTSQTTGASTGASALGVFSQTLNALRINGAGLTVGSSGAGQSLTLTSGGLLVTGGADTLSIPVVALAATEGIIHVSSGAAATMTGSFTGTAGLTKADGGSLSLAAPQYYTGATTVNAGTLRLAGATNTLFFNNALTLNAGGTLDLNGGVQYVGALNSAGATFGSAVAGGTVISTGGLGTFVTNGAGTFAGSIGGAGVAFARSGAGTLNLLGASTYGGSTLLNGGLTILADNGAFASNGPITINYATLQLDNSRLTDSSTRLSSSAPIFLNGGLIQLNGRAGTLSTQTLGPVTLNQGLSFLSAANGSNSTTTNIESATLVLTSLTRNGDAVVDFGQQYQATAIGTATGALGLNATALGQSENILVNGGVPLVNNLIGGWAVVSAYANNNASGSAFFDFASYNATSGVGMISTAGFAGYDAAALPAVIGTAAAAQNIKITATATLPTGGMTTINALNLLSGAISTLTFTAPTDTLNLASGGLIVSGNFANSIGGAANSGRLTAGGAAASGTSDLYLYNVQSTLTINSQIVDNPNGALVQLVANGLTNITGFGASTMTLAGTNSYSGGTIVNGETLTVAATGYLPAGGLGLTINNGTVTTAIAQGTGPNVGIASQAVTLNGGAVLTLVGNNSLTSLTFNDNGGTATPTVTPAGVLTLTGGTPISVSSSNVATVPTVGVGTLDFGSAAKTIFVDAITVNSQAVAPLAAGLNISSLIQNAGQILKTGSGNLELSSATSTFTGGVNLSQGGLILNANSNGSAFGSVVTAGPLGTGTLTIGANTSLLAAAASTVANPVVVSGNFTFDGLTNLTLNGNVTLPASAGTHIAVNAPQMTATLGGNVSGASAMIIKDGLGILALAGPANAYTGGVTLNNGTLLATGAKAFGSGPVTINGGLLQLKNNGSGSNSLIAVGNDLTLGAGLSNAFIDINNNGANTNNTFVFGSLNSQPSTVLNVSGGNGYRLQFSSSNLGSAAGPATFNPGSGLSIVLPGGFSDTTRPINIGPGNLVLTGNNTFTANTTVTGTQVLLPQANSVSAPFGTGNLILSSGATLQITPTPGNLSTTGYVGGTNLTGGLAGRYGSFLAAPVLTATGASSFTAGAVIGGLPGSDTDLYNHPANGIMNSNGVAPIQDVEQYSGILKVTNAGTYSFGLDKDDEAVLFVDGVRVLSLGDGSAGASAAGGYVAGFTTSSLPLTPGNHSIVVMHQNGGGGSGFQLIYNGADTTTGSLAAPGAGWQGIALGNLLYNTAGVAGAGNGYLNAAQVNNAVVLNAGAAATLDGAGAQYNSTVASLNLGNNSTLTVNNLEGVGTIGSIGAATVGTGVTLSPGTGTLYLIGGVNDGAANGLTKAGAGTLILGSSGVAASHTFTGAFTANAGTVLLADPDALSSGSNTIAGTTSTAFVVGGLTQNSAVVTTTNTTGLVAGEQVFGPNIVPGTTILSISAGVSVTLTAAIPNVAGTTQTVPIYFFSNASSANGAVLDLNGISNVTNGFTINGAGPGVRSSSSPASLYNSSATAASVSGSVTIGAAGTSIGGYGDIALNGTLADGGNTWLKVGPDTLTLAGNNTGLSGALGIAGGLLRLGNAGALGTSASNGLTVFVNAALDLNGQTISTARPLALFGIGSSGLPTGVSSQAMNNTLGSLINSSATLATYAGPITLGNGAIGIGSSNFDNTVPGGDILLTGSIGQAAAGTGINKVGLDTVTVQGNIATTTGGSNIQQGAFVLSGTAGAFTAGAPVTVLSGATLLLDNTLGNVAGGRLGLGLNGGETINGNFTLIGNSAGTTELLSTAARTLTFANSGSIVTLQPDPASGLLFNISSNTALTRTAGATSLFRGNGLGTATLANAATTVNTAGFGDGTTANPGFTGSTTTTGTSRGVLPWALVDTTNTGSGSSFAAYDTTNGFRALNFATDGVTDTLTAGTNVLSATGVTTATGGITTINSLTLNGGGATIAAGSALLISSGGVLNLVGSAGAPTTISGPGVLTSGAAIELILHSVAGATLSISSQIAGTTGPLTKADGGTVILGARELNLGNLFVNGGTLQLNGGSQTLFTALNAGQAPGVVGAASNGQVLQVNLGGTLDLNGNSQIVANLNSANPLPNTGGTVLNNGATLATFQTVQSASQTFAGFINGNLNYLRSSGFTQTFESPSNFSGSFTTQGGNTILQDLGAFTGVSTVNLNGGVLTWTDTGTQAVAARLPAATPFNFNTGSFTYNARNGVQGAIAIGNAIFNTGSSLISVNPNNGGANLTIGTGTGASLTHNVGGTVAFFGAGTGGGIGDQAHIYLGTPPTLTGGLVGAWATAYQNDSFIGQSTQPGFAIYTSNGIESLNKDLVTIATGNVPAGSNARQNANVTLPAGGATLNTLSIINSAATLTFAAATDTLTLTAGGLLTGADANNKAVGASAGQGQLTAGASQPELFIHVGANTLTINSKIIDNGVAGGLNLVADPMAGAGALTLTAANAYLGTTYLNGINTTLNSTGGPSVPGNLVVTGGVSTTDSTAFTTTFGASNQLASTSAVTLKGGATLNLAGFTNTIASLTLDNTSGDLSGVGATVNTGSGVLTVSGAVTVTNNTNSFLAPQINGFLSLSSATPTFSVAANPLNPQLVGLDLAANVSLTAPATTPLTLTGGGVIALSGQSPLANGLAVAAGTTLVFGQPGATTGAAAPFASVANSRVNLAAGATLDTRGLNGVIGSLVGSGTVTDTITATNTAGTLTTANTSTLTTGADNVATAQFDGTFTNPFVQSLLNVAKIGSGTMVLTADNSGTGLNSPNLGTLTVSQGLVSLNGTVARLGFTTDSLQTGGSLTLDNRTNALSNRLGGQFLLVSPAVAANTARNLTFQGGSLNLFGNSTAAIVEGVGSLTPANGGFLNLTAQGTAGVNLAVVNVAGQGGQTSLRINADNLGIAAVGTANDSNITVSGTYAIPGTQGAGAAGTTLLPIRPDIVATDTVSGATAFVFKDANGLRLLNPASEYLTTTAGLVANGAVAAANAFNLGLSSTSAQQTISTNVPVGSITLFNGGGLSNGLGATAGNLAGSGLQTVTLGSGGVLALSGNTGLSVGAFTSVGITMDLHVVGAATTLNLNGSIVATTSGVVKADEGTLAFNAPQFFTGTNGTQGLAINGGKVVLNGGVNTVLVAPTATAPTVQSLFLNGGTLDLNGNNQAFERIASINTVAGQPANSITSASAANLITVPATGVTTSYAGKISGAISLYKEGAGTTTGTLILTGPNDYSGTTNVVGGTLALRDLGSLTGTSAINVNYGQLTLDNTGLSDSTSRISTVVPINLSGGTLTVAAGQRVESESIGTTTLTQGLNQLNLLQYGNNVQTGSYTLVVGNLVQQGNATLNFVNNTVIVGQTAGNPHVFLTQLNNANFAAANLTNGLIGGWAISNGADFASYTDATGVVALGGVNGSPAYGALGGGAAANANVGATVQSVLGQTINSLAIRAPGAATTVALFDASQVLNLASGGLLINDSGAKGVGIQGGRITAGGASTGPASLYLYTNTGTQTINSQFVDNGANAVSLVRSGAGTITLTPQIIDTVASVAATSGTITVNNAQGLFVGMVVSGTNITAASTITAINGNVITLSANTGGTVSANVQVTFAPPAVAASTTTAGSTGVTLGSAAPAGITVGMAVGGPNIAGGTTVAAISGTSLTLSQPALVTGAANATITLGAVSNSYTGMTFANGGNSVFGTLNVSGVPGSIVIPGDLTVGNSGVTETVQGGIAATSNVTFVSGGTLTLFGTNTLNTLTFNGNGTSGGTGTAAVGTLLNLSGANAISATNNDLGHTPTVSGAGLALNNANPAIATQGLSPDDLIVSAPITAAGGIILKTGAGSVVLSGASTFTTGLNVQGGSVIFGAGSTGTPVTSGPAGTGTLTLSGGLAGSTVLSDGTARNIGNAVSVTNGGFTFGGTVAGNNLTLSGTVTLGAGANSIGVAAPTVSGTISGVLTGGTDFTKTGPGGLILSNAANTYGGQTIVSGGVLKNGVANAVPNTSLLTVNSGSEYDLNNFGQVTQQIAGTGLITNSGAAAQTLVVGGTSATDVTTNVNSAFAGSFTNAAQALNVTEVGLGTLTLSGTSNHTGKTTVRTGTLTASTANAFSPLSSVVLGNNLTGASATAGALTLGGFNQALGGLIVQDDNTTVSALNPAVNTLSIATGTTLTLGAGGLIVGVDAGAVVVPTVSKLTVSGGGTLAINGGNVQIGVSQTTADSTSNSVATVDLTGLTGGFTSSGTTFNVGQGHTSAGTLLLTNTANTIVATTIDIGDSNGNNGISTSTLQLGTGTNVLQADTINIGRSKGSDPGVLKFAAQTAGSAGTVTIANKAGTGAANIDIGNVNATSTGGGAIGTLDLRGHVATVNAGTVTLANNNNPGTGSTTGTLNFDTGTFTAATLNLAPKTAAGVATATATVNVSGGAFSVAGVTTLGSEVTAGTSVATLSLTGGTFTSGGNIVDGGGTSTSNLTLNGGTLDLTGHTVGSAAVSIDNLLLQSGTLRNVAEINNGAALSKTTTGTLVLSGTNAFTGALTVSAGIASVASNTGLGATSAGTTVSGGASLELQNNLVVGAESLSITGGGSGGTGALRNLSGNNVYGGNVTLAGNAALQSDAGLLTLSSATPIAGTGFGLTVQGAGNVEIDSGLATGAGGSLTKLGAGTLTLGGSGVSTYAGATTITAGLVSVANPAALSAATSSIGVSAGGSLELQAGVSLANTATTTIAGTGSNANGALRGLSGSTMFSGPLAIGAGGATIQADAGTLTVNPAAGLTGTGQALTVQGSGTVILPTGVNTGAGGALTVAGPGVVVLSGSSSYTGGTTISGGTAQINTPTSLGDVSGGVTLTGGTLEVVPSTSISSSRSFSLGTAGAIQVDAGSTYTLNGILADRNGTTAGVLSKTGSGTLALGGVESYTGGTSIKAGTLALLPSGSISGSLSVVNGANFDVSAVAGGFTLAAGRTLATSGATGTATVTGSLTTAGTLAPGGPGAVGSLSVTGSLALNGALQAKIAGPGQSDQITTPALSLGAGATLQLSLLNGYSAIGDGLTYTLINNTGTSPIGGAGVFSNTTSMMVGTQTLNVVTASDGEIFAVSYSGEGGSFSVAGGNDVVLMAVPEPSAVGSLIVGLASLAGLQRFRRRATRG